MRGVVWILARRMRDRELAVMPLTLEGVLGAQGAFSMLRKEPSNLALVY